MSRIEESITKLQAFVVDVQNKASEQVSKCGAEDKLKVEAIADKTIQTIKNSINKLETMKDQIFDENEINDFLDRLEDKCKDVTEFTKSKIDEIKPIAKTNLADLKDELDKGFDEIKKDSLKFKSQASEEYEKLLENENIKKAIQFAKETKDKAIEYYNRPETQEAINNAKLKIIDVAEKGLDTLKVILEKDNDL